MAVAKKLLTLLAPVALLGLGACATGLPTQVTRFQALPAPQGQTFVIQADDPRNQGGLEFSQYAALVRQHLLAQGYREAASAQDANLIVSFDYGVDNGQPQITTYPALDPWFNTGFYSARWWNRGWRGPFFYGWHDPFASPFYNEVDVHTVFTSYLDLQIRRAADGQSLFEGHAKARSRTDQLQALVPNLVEAMFTGFPGNSGETVKITIPAPPRDRR